MSKSAPPLTEEQLRLLLLGHLPESEVERLSNDLVDDVRLLAVAETIDNLADTLLDQLRDQEPYTDPAVEKFVERIVNNFNSRQKSESPGGSEPDTFLASLRPEPTEKGVGSGPYVTGPLSIPLHLEHFRVISKLGEGGMGAVYLAQDTRLDRRVALKTLRPEIADVPGAKERFLREARSVAALEHQHILAIYHVGESHGVSYLAMPLLRGNGLNELMRQKKPLPLDEAMSYCRQIAEGLAAAHSVGLIHRDIKPSNVWIEPIDGGRVKILDFGLARRSHEAVQLTGSGAILGTPAYMAPEQGRGQPVDHRADLFSLGVILYEMTTGKRPFTGSDTMSILTSLAIDEPESPATLNPGIPASLSTLTMKLLAKKPENRPQTAREVSGQLLHIQMQATRPIIEVLPVAELRPSIQAALDPWEDIDATTETTPPSVKPQAIPSRKKSTPLFKIVAAVAFLAVCVIVGQIVIKIKNKDGTERVKKVDPNQVEITGPKGEPSYPPPKGEEGVFLPKPKPPTFPGVIPYGESPLDKLDPKEIPVVERYDWQPKELVAVIGEHRQRRSSWYTSLRFSPDGKQVIDSFGHESEAFELQTGRVAISARTEGGYFQVPHPSEVGVFATGLGVFVEKDGQSLLRHSFPIPDFGASFVSFTNDGSWLLAYEYPDKCRLYAYSPDKLSERAVYENVHWAAFSPRSDLIAVAHRDGVIRIYDLTTPKLAERSSIIAELKNQKWNSLTRGDGLQPVGGWVEFNADGVLLVGNPVELTLTAYDVSGPQPKELAKSSQFVADNGWIRCSPRGNLVFAGSGHWTRVLELTKTGFKATPGPAGWRFFDFNLSSLTFSRDGTKMATGSSGNFMQIWDIGGPFIKEIDPLKPNPYSFDLNRDGMLAVTSEAMNLEYWNLNGKTPVKSKRSEINRSNHSPKYSPDGKTLFLPWSGELWQESRLLSGIPSGAVVGFPDSNRVATLGKDKFAITDFSKDPPEILSEIPAEFTVANAQPLLTPDSQTVVYGAPNGGIGLYDVKAQGVSLRLAIPESEKLATVLDCALSPDGHLLAVGGQGGVAVWDLSKKTPEQKWKLADGWGQGTSVSFSPDGRSLVSGSGRRFLVLDATTGKLQREWNLPYWVTKVTFAPDGRHLLVLCNNRVLYVFRLNG